MKRPYVVTLDEVRISRQGEYAIIEYFEPNVYTTYLKIGPEVQHITDQEILDKHNQILRNQEKMRAECEHTAVEIPLGRPQIKYSELCNQWTPRGDVLRCVIGDDGPSGEAVIYIDDQELSLEEFGRLLTTYAGWGMRVVFVPDDQTHEQPDIEMRDPNDEKDSRS
jgi:hypothetical protein